MILLDVLLGFIGVATVFTLLDQFYDDFAKWLRQIPKIVEKAINGVLIGVKAFIDTTKQKLGFGVETSKSYSYDGNKWQITTTTRNIPASEVPPEYLDKARYGEVDITDELESVMQGG